MKMEAILETQAAVVVFSLLEARPQAREGKFQLSVAATPVDVNLGSPISTRLFLQDVVRLREYLQEHVSMLLEGESQESYVYAPLELGFQLQAQEGEIESLMDGSFSIAFSVRRTTDEAVGGSYFGFESTVDVTSIHRFSAELDLLVAAIGGG